MGICPSDQSPENKTNRNADNQRISMLITSQRTKMESYEGYDTLIELVDESFKMKVQLIKVEKGELLNIGNPRYDRLMNEDTHLREAEMADSDIKKG